MHTHTHTQTQSEISSCVFQGFVSFLLPCFAVDHLCMSYDDYLFSEEETPISEGQLEEHTHRFPF